MSKVSLGLLKDVTWFLEKKNLVAVVVLAVAQPSCCTRPLALNGLQSLFLQALDSLYTAGGRDGRWRVGATRVPRRRRAGGSGGGGAVAGVGGYTV